MHSNSGLQNERCLDSRLRSQGRYPPKVELPERKQQRNRLPTQVRLARQLVPHRNRGIYRSFAFSPENSNLQGGARYLREQDSTRSRPLPSTLCFIGAEERTRTFTLLARCLQDLVPKKGLEPSRCLRVAFKIWCRRKDSNLHTLASTWT